MNIVEQMAEAITEYGLPEESVAFTKDVAEFHSGRTFSNLPDSEQITLMNRYFRTSLAHRPNTTNIRSWLEESNSTSRYLHAFQANWLPMLVNIGFFEDLL